MLSGNVLRVIAHAKIYLGRFDSDERSTCQAFEEGVPEHGYLKIGIRNHSLNVDPHIRLDSLSLKFLKAVLQGREKESLEEFRDLQFLSTFFRSCLGLENSDRLNIDFSTVHY